MTKSDARTTLPPRLSESQLDESSGEIGWARTAPGGLMRLGAPELAAAGGLGSEALPNRYEIRELDEGHFLLCNEAPTMSVSIDRRHAFTEAEARRLGERTILLDGAGQFAPLVDDGAHLYNLDHHQECLRAFTLATCEQALILVLKGLHLEKGAWTIYANEPDLDTVFALWVLLNHRRVRALSPEQRDSILPMLRLEGAIDANGFEIADYCGLPQDLVAAEKERLDRLHAHELELKRSGAWGKIDLLEYTLEMLLRIDHQVYRSTDFHDYSSVEEVYGHVEIGDDKVAVVCRDGSGIYEVEKRLRKVWGDRLGLVALERQPGHYTLRRTAALSGIALQDAYDKLNLLDPAVDGRPPEKRWGGSDDIGGSPRPDGTSLTPREIGKILKLSFKKFSSWQQIRRLIQATVWTFGLVAGAGAVAWGWRFFTAPLRTPTAAAAELAVVAVLLWLGSWFLTRRLSRGWTWLFGWRVPAGYDWLFLTPAVVLAGVLGGAWIPAVTGSKPGQLLAGMGAIVLAAGALELCFRGLMHGLLVLDDRVQSVRGRWLLSRPALAAAFLYAAVTAAVVALGLWIAPPAWELSGTGPWGAAGVTALASGLALGMIRERSLSVWPGVLAAAAGGILRMLLQLW